MDVRRNRRSERPWNQTTLGLLWRDDLVPPRHAPLTLHGHPGPGRLFALAAEPLAGELACSFSGGDDQLLLVARGNVASDDPAFGVVKVSGYVERVAAPGGFDAMLDGASFAGRGKTVVIAVTGPAEGGGESPPRPAPLTYRRADGASRVFQGLWTCGP